MKRGGVAKGGREANERTRGVAEGELRSRKARQGQRVEPKVAIEQGSTEWAWLIGTPSSGF